MSDEPAPTETHFGSSQSGAPAASAGQSGLAGLTTALGIEPARPGQDPLLGCDIGGVTIVRLIAEGGMGRVYEGKQQKPNRIVAVKVMRPGLTSPSVLKRFEYEAEVLGRLQHPGIAHIYSVGVHKVGSATVPYFVMEYIPEAKSLTAYAEELKLPTRQRLDLFRSVCDAVAHGHQKGVIHRDLKPSNILVDASGQPKVIDFGVARATDSDMALTTMQTDVGQLIGTLQYMSPEQLDADPNNIDVRSDVYALGVVLYELLTGKPPYDVKKKAVLEVMRIVKEEDPTPLSSLNKTLRRDVGVIAGKCLEKDRGRRYSSASELSSDISRYLTGEAILAAPPSFWDGLARLARRHRAVAATVLGIAVSLVVAAIGISVFAVRAERAREEADRQGAVAVQERDAAAQARATAEAEEKKAKQRSYRLLLAQLCSALDGSGRTSAKQICLEADAAYRDAYGYDSRTPLELILLRPELDAAIDVLRGHESSISCLAFSPDGLRLATGSDDQAIRIWDPSTGKSLAVFKGHEASILSLAFSPDGSRLATGSADQTVRIWDPSTGESLAVVKGHNASILSLAFSPDGSRLATGSVDRTARIWDATTGDELVILRGHGSEIRSLAFSPDGSRLATGSKDTTAKIWDATTGNSIAVLKGHTGAILSLAFSLDGSRLATGSRDLSARIWDATTGNKLAVLEGHGNEIQSLAFSPDGSRLATGSRDQSVRIWDATKGESLAVLKGHDASISSLAFNPDGSRLATGSEDQTIRIWDLTKDESLGVLRGHLGWIFSLAFSPDGSRLVTSSRFSRIWDATTGESLAVLQWNNSIIRSVAFSPDGSRLATGSDDQDVRIWDAATGQSLAVLKGHDARIFSLAFSPDGSRLATGSEDQTVRIWDAATGESLAVLKGHSATIFSLAFSPDGSRLATGSWDRTIRVWDAATGESLAVLKGHDSKVPSLAFSPDGSRLAAGSVDYTARVWDATTGEPLAVLKGHDNEIQAIAFSPDGSRLATGSVDHTARIWDATTGESLAVLKGHNNEIQAIAFSPDGLRLATGSKDYTVRIWGLSNADIHRNRNMAAAVQQRLMPLVNGWFTGELASVKRELTFAKTTMKTDDWREAANMVLRRVTSELSRGPLGAKTPEQVAPSSERRLWQPKSAGAPVFRRSDSGEWTALHSDGRRYRFVQSAETTDYIELRCGMGRDLRMRLSANGSQLQANKSEWGPWWPGTWVNDTADAQAMPSGAEILAKGTAPNLERKFWRPTSASDPAFQREDTGEWTELCPDGRRHRFAQAAETSDYIELRCDMGRDLRVRLSANGSQLQQNMSDWGPWHAGTWVNEATALQTMP